MRSEGAIVAIAGPAYNVLNRAAPEHQKLAAGSGTSPLSDRDWR